GGGRGAPPPPAPAAGGEGGFAPKRRLGGFKTVFGQSGGEDRGDGGDSALAPFLPPPQGGPLKNDAQTHKHNGVREASSGYEASIAKWLLSLGVIFDRDGDGNLHVKKGGGSSKPRLITASDYTGLEIMRVLKDEVLNQEIQLLEFCAAVELLSDGQGTCTGAV